MSLVTSAVLRALDTLQSFHGDAVTYRRTGGAELSLTAMIETPVRQPDSFLGRSTAGADDSRSIYIPTADLTDPKRGDRVIVDADGREYLVDSTPSRAAGDVLWKLECYLDTFPPGFASLTATSAAAGTFDLAIEIQSAQADPADLSAISDVAFDAAFLPQLSETTVYAAAAVFEAALAVDGSLTKTAAADAAFDAAYMPHHTLADGVGGAAAAAFDATPVVQEAGTETVTAAAEAQFDVTPAVDLPQSHVAAGEAQFDAVTAAALVQTLEAAAESQFDAGVTIQEQGSISTTAVFAGEAQSDLTFALETALADFDGIAEAQSAFSQTISVEQDLAAAAGVQAAFTQAALVTASTDFASEAHFDALVSIEESGEYDLQSMADAAFDAAIAVENAGQAADFAAETQFDAATAVSASFADADFAAEAQFDAATALESQLEPAAFAAGAQFDAVATASFTDVLTAAAEAQSDLTAAVSVSQTAEAAAEAQSELVSAVSVSETAVAAAEAQSDLAFLVDVAETITAAAEAQAQTTETADAPATEVSGAAASFDMVIALGIGAQDLAGAAEIQFDATVVVGGGDPCALLDTAGQEISDTAGIVLCDTTGGAMSPDMQLTDTAGVALTDTAGQALYDTTGP